MSSRKKSLVKGICEKNAHALRYNVALLGRNEKAFAVIKHLFKLRRYFVYSRGSQGVINKCGGVNHRGDSERNNRDTERIGAKLLSCVADSRSGAYPRVRYLNG